MIRGWNNKPYAIFFIVGKKYMKTDNYSQEEQGNLGGAITNPLI